MFGNISPFDAVVWYLAFLFSTTLHEASHAYAALKLGDDTAHRGGQVTLDPTPHIKREPFGMVLVPLLSLALGGWMMGWASAPYDPYWAHRHPRRAAIMAMAGPASNLLLVVIAAILIRLGMVFGYFEVPEEVTRNSIVGTVGTGLPHMFATILTVMFSLNLLLFLFNLLPFPPLDGSAVPLFFLSDENSAKYSEAIRNPAFALVGFILSMKLFGIVFPAIRLFAINLLYPEATFG